MKATKQRWRELCRRIGAKDNPETGRTIDSTYDQLIRAYSGPDRFYHNFDHIISGLAEIDKVRHFADDPDSLEMGWFWHDYKYDPRSKTNEEDSAASAIDPLRELGVQPGIITSTLRIVLATKHDHIPQHRDSRLAIDIDLVSLASPPNIFDFNTDCIRREFSHIPEEDFRKGNAMFLKKIVDSRPTIYLTGYFHHKYEARAMSNVKRLLKKYA